MAKLSPGQKRRHKELKRRKKKQAQARKPRSVIEVQSTALGLPKLSERLLEFAGDYLDAPDVDESYLELLLSIVVMCWNIGAVTGQRATDLRESMEEALEKMGAPLPEDMKTQIDFWINRRRFVYGDDPRFVDDLDVSWRGPGDYYIQVASFLLPEEECFSFSMGNLAAGMSDGMQERMAWLEEPFTEQEQELLELLDRGEQCLNAKNGKESPTASVDACNLWLQAWERIKDCYPDQASLEDIESKISLPLSAWSTDMDMHLLNATCSDLAMGEKGITFLREFIEYFPESHEATLRAYRRAIAELQFRFGADAEGNATFEALMKDFPDFTWGYIGWGDIYNPLFSGLSAVPADIERSKQLYRIPVVQELEGAEAAHERLEELAAYEKQEAGEFLA